MKDLQLSLKKKWFDMTKSRVKTEDYREITEYWFKRLTISFSGIDSKNKRAFSAFCNLLNKSDIINANKHLKTKHFERNIMTLGYPKSSDTNRILKIEHRGIEIAKGNPEWGAIPDKYYFVIKHGKETV